MFVIKKWGYEFWIENNNKYCGKHLHIIPTRFCSAHYHKNKQETFYVINGELLLEYSSDQSIETWQYGVKHKKILKSGDSFTIMPNIVHRFSSNLNTPCDFIEIST